MASFIIVCVLGKFYVVKKKVGPTFFSGKSFIFLSFSPLVNLIKVGKGEAFVFIITSSTHVLIST